MISDSNDEPSSDDNGTATVRPAPASSSDAITPRDSRLPAPIVEPTDDDE